MVEPSPSSLPSSPSSRNHRKRERPFKAWEEIRRQETEASMAVLYERRKKERLDRRIYKAIGWWPVAAGIVLSLFAPMLKELAEAAGPWAMTLVFPFVVVSQRPEIYLGDLTHYLPTVVLYAQFPLEGLFARLVLRRGLKPAGVAAQVCMFHLLGILELVMLTSVPAQLLHR